jgi:hypothetical protein
MTLRPMNFYLMKPLLMTQEKSMKLLLLMKLEKTPRTLLIQRPIQ